MMRFGQRRLDVDKARGLLFRCAASVQMLRILILCGLSFVSTPASAAAQTLTGRVLEGTSDRVITDAVLTLLHPDGRTLGTPVLSGEDGRFVLPVPGPGEYFMRAEKLGYLAIVDGIFAFEEVGGRLNVAVYLAPQPVDLAGLEVRVEMRRIRRNLETAGFYRRADAGWGIFVGPEQITSTLVVNTSDHLRRVPGIRFRDGRVLFSARPDPRNTDPEAQLCEPTIYLDGARLIGQSSAFGTEMSGMGLDDRVRPEEVVAIEVYRRVTEVPFQYYGNRPDRPFCGTILLWTKSGR